MVVLSNNSNRLHRVGLCLLLSGLLMACGGGGGGGGSDESSNTEEGTAPNNNGGVTAGSNNCTSNGAGNVTISGRLTFDHVPFNATVDAGLDYANTQRLPAPGIRMQAICSDGAVLAETATNANGQFALAVPANQEVFVRARAQLLQSNGFNPNGGLARWDVRVLSNTGGRALYVLDGAVQNSTAGNTTRNLHAASGWSQSQRQYTQLRAAAPFTMLNDIYASIQKTVAVDGDVNFPALVVNWSPNNRTCTSSDLSTGCIGTSFYLNGELYILGAANDDTDEYDEHIIIHEWGHYFEDQLSRSDSIGGSHSLNERLDMRVAMGEGFGNALSGIVTDDPVYRDSSGRGQSSDFAINVEINDRDGWFNEASVQSVLYDLYDANPDGGNDNLALGWQPLYETFTSSAYRNTASLTSIFSFLDYMQDNAPGQAAQIEALANHRGINSLDEFADGETNNAGSNDVLPVYTPLTNGATRTVCSIDDFGNRNKLSVFRFLAFTPTASGSHRVEAVAAGNDPDVLVYRNGEIILALQSNSNENGTVNLQAGQTVVLGVYAFDNFVDPENDRICINVRVTRQ